MRKIRVVVEVHFVFEDENYYQILNIPFQYDVDKELVKSRYLRLYKSIIEEANKFSKDVEFMESYLSILNASYKCLLDDLSRAEHYLKLKGKIPVVPKDTEFLSIIFNVRSLPKEEREIKLSEVLSEYKELMVKDFEKNDLDSACSNLSKIKFLASNADE